MSANKPTECFHRITQFQAHRYCNLFASICQKECQQIHKSDKDQILLISLQTIQQQFKRIMEILSVERNKYSNKLKSFYQSIIEQIEKHMKNSLTEMEAQIQAEMMKKLTIQKSLIEKLQNKRYQRVKCNQLISMIEQTQPQQKIKKSALAEIYQKYKSQTNKFRESLFQGKPIPPILENSKKQTQTISVTSQQKSIQPQKQKANLINNNLFNIMSSSANNSKYLLLYEQKKKQFKKLQQFNEKLKYDLKVLTTQKSNLQRELTILKSTKSYRKKKLILKTWNIAQVITKKIKKFRIQTQQSEIQSQAKQNKDKNQIIIQETQSNLNQNIQSSKLQHKQVVELQQKNAISMLQNGLSLPPKEVLAKASVNLQMQDQQEQVFFDYLRKRKLV